MVDLVGIEPTTSSMPWKRAPSCATGPRGENGWTVLILACCCRFGQCTTRLKGLSKHRILEEYS
jgi:hypothetical protein